MGVEFSNILNFIFLRIISLYIRAFYWYTIFYNSNIILTQLSRVNNCEGSNERISPA